MTLVVWSVKSLMNLCGAAASQRENQKSKRKNISELFADYKEDYFPEEIDWGNSVGNELLEDK